ncbi:MAG: pseudouridine synthase [archaeon]|nr:pseudouridine synthase [archaeon]
MLYVTEKFRLNKFIADSGYCSRRKADILIDAGRVTVDEKPAEKGVKVTLNNIVRIDGQVVTRDEELIILIFNKPPGITCTTLKSDSSNVIQFLNYPKRIYPVGRLDKYSEGLLILTNKGDIVNGIMRSRYNHEKEYLVTVDRPITDNFIKKMTTGIYLSELKVTTKPCFAEKIARNKFKIVITQGLNRQIRRMCEQLDFRVMKLKRTRVLDIELKDLPVGKYRKATQEEINSIIAQINQ